ncbi:MAG TPA: hypothetical protein EYM37_08305 [Methylophaga aminisulfidivorans]|nr:hypothetical protein [Methylophaga aminisulfidivorans]
MTKIEALDKAISFVGEVRASFGALQNRFQSKLKNLSNIVVSIYAVY